VVLNGTSKDAVKFCRAFHAKFKDDHPLPPLLCLKDSSVLSSSGLLLSAADVVQADALSLHLWPNDVSPEKLSEKLCASPGARRDVDSLKCQRNDADEALVKLNGIEDELVEEENDLARERKRGSTTSSKRKATDDGASDGGAGAAGSASKSSKGTPKRPLTAQGGKTQKNPRK